jgi:hypothetical protein
MQVIELIQLGIWCKTNIEEKGIAVKYTSLYSKMNQNIRRNNMQNQSVSFEAEKNALLESIKEVNFQSLTLEQIKFLEKIKILDLLGEKGVIQIEDVLYKNSLDIATATAKIKSMSDIVTTTQTTINELSTTLRKSFDIEDFDNIMEGEILVRIYFKVGAAINNLTDFKTYSNLWHEIGRGIAMAQDKTPEDFRIIGASKGSIIISMAVAVVIATSISKILLEALKVTDRVLDIRKKIEEIKKLKFENKKIEADIKTEAEKAKETGIKNILNIITKELGLQENSQGDKIVALEKSIKDLIDFTEKGGIIDFVQRENKEEANSSIRTETNKLNKNISEIRALESKMKALDNK